MSIMNKGKALFVFLVTAMATNCFADAGQLLPGFSNKNSLENKLKKYKTDKTYVGGNSEELKLKKYKKKSAHLIGSSDGSLETSSSARKTSGIAVLGTKKAGPTISKTSNVELIKKYSNKGKTNFSFSYFIDSYDYKDTRSTFNRTFVDSSEGKRGGNLIISGQNYFSKGRINTNYGVNVGAGFNYGKGIFSQSSEVSDVNFKVWAFPLDLTVGFEVPVGTWLKITASGGPSALGLIQSRSDRSDDDVDKKRKQVGFGYAATAKLKFNLSSIFPAIGVEVNSSYDVSDFYMNLEARMQNYDNFGDEITVTGTSFGIGFTFEFL